MIFSRQIMSSATGNIIRAEDTLVARFPIDGVVYTFFAPYDDALPDPSCSQAILTYSSVEELTGTRLFRGTIGVESLSLVLENNVTINGRINTPANPPATITSEGTWALN